MLVICTTGKLAQPQDEGVNCETTHQKTDLNNPYYEGRLHSLTQQISALAHYHASGILHVNRILIESTNCWLPNHIIY